MGTKLERIAEISAATPKKILEAIYEPRFLNCMYGFRANRGCHDAVKEMHYIINPE